MVHSSMAECPPSREMVASATAQGDWPGSQWLPAALPILEWHRVWGQDALELDPRGDAQLPRLLLIQVHIGGRGRR